MKSFLSILKGFFVFFGGGGLCEFLPLGGLIRKRWGEKKRGGFWDLRQKKTQDKEGTTVATLYVQEDQKWEEPNLVGGIFF